MNPPALRATTSHGSGVLLIFNHLRGYFRGNRGTKTCLPLDTPPSWAGHLLSSRQRGLICSWLARLRRYLWAVVAFNSQSRSVG